MSNYQGLVEAVNQVEHDQSLFQAELGNELPGALHAELVELGSIMARILRVFVDKGKFFSDQQQPNVLGKMIEAVHDYISLLMPAKVCGGFCPCLKPARSGPEYEKRYLMSRTKVVSVTFLAHSILIENKAEKYNMDSMHFADFANKMNNIFNVLSSISTKGNDDQRENTRGELLNALEMVNRFMKSFDEETTDFKAECRRRLTSTNELLTTRPADGGAITRRVLVKAQSSLQEIMNTAAALSLQRAREAMQVIIRAY